MDNREEPENSGNKVQRAESAEKRYHTGYVPGVFDLFHMGHLNLLRGAGERCEYLMAGVLSDELVVHFKGKPPYIPYEERAEIVRSIRFVDEVVKVDFHNTVKMDAWRLYHYDAYFSGDDHGNEWEEERKQLREVGADIVFLPYTRSTSSTRIKKKLVMEQERKNIYLFGAGAVGKNFLTFLQHQKGYGEKWQVLGILDNRSEKNLEEMRGVTVYSSDYMKFIRNKDCVRMIITTYHREEVEKQLRDNGFTNVSYFEDFPGYLTL